MTYSAFDGGTASSSVLGHFCFTPNATCILFSCPRYCVKASCSLASACSFGKALLARTSNLLQKQPNFRLFVCSAFEILPSRVPFCFLVQTSPADPWRKLNNQRGSHRTVAYVLSEPILSSSLGSKAVLLHYPSCWFRQHSQSDPTSHPSSPLQRKLQVSKLDGMLFERMALGNILAVGLDLWR